MKHIFSVNWHVNELVCIPRTIAGEIPAQQLYIGEEFSARFKGRSYRLKVTKIELNDELTVYVKHAT